MPASWSGRGDPPAGYTIKANEESMLYNTPDSSAYTQTDAELWFIADAAAQEAG
jgi:hypothetical protein